MCAWASEPLYVGGTGPNVTLDHKTSLKSLYICSDSQKYTVWVKIIVKILSKIMFHEDNLIIFYCKYITSFIVIFLALSDSRFSNICISAKYCPILTNHTSMEILFIQLSDDV